MLIFAAALPPPVHGQSLVTRQILDLVGKLGLEVAVFDTSPKSLRRRSFGYHLNRIHATARALCFILYRTCIRPRGVSDVAYMVSDSGWGLIYSISLGLAFRLTGAKIFIHHHTAKFLSEKSSGFSLLFAVLGRNAIQVVLCEQMAEDLRRLYGEKFNVVSVSNAAFIPPTTASSTTRPSGKVRIGMISNLSLEKGLQDALNILPFVREGGYSLELHLAGPFADAVASRLVSEAKDEFGDALVYHGPLFEERKKNFFESIDVFIFPTRYQFEAQPLVVFEAHSHGLPVVCFDRGYIRFMLDQHDILISRDVDFVASLMHSLQESKESDWTSELARDRRRQNYNEVCMRSQRDLKNLLHSLRGDSTDLCVLDKDI